MELTLTEALQKGVEAHKTGALQEAERYYTAILKANPKHPDANHNMGVLAAGVGKVEAALPFFKIALEVKPSTAQFWLSYIDALIKLGQIEDAKAVLEQAKSKGAKGDGFDQIENRLASATSKKSNSQEPPLDQLKAVINLYTQAEHQEALNQASQLLKRFANSVILHNIIGAANKGLGRLDDAIEAYKKAISLKPDYADVYNNMGIALKDQSKLDEAIEAYNKAISLKPDYAEAYCNVGNALKDQGKLENAIEAYTKAISLKPDYAEAYNNIGIALQDQGKLEHAIEAYTKAITTKPNYAEAYYNMGNALKGVIFKKPNKGIQKIIISLLEKKTYVRPHDIAKSAISLLKLEPTLQKYLQLADAGVTESPIDVILDLSKLPLLLKLMSSCPLPDLELEKLFKDLRCSILSNISSLKKASSELIGFQSALALHSFTNEYVYNHTDEEEKLIQSLEASVKKDLENNEQPRPQVVLALASYKSLNQYEWCNLLVSNDPIKEVFTRQVEEPLKEKELKLNIPLLGEITDSISSKVRAQYEESPYPRWINLGLYLTPMSISKVVNEANLKLHDQKINEVKAPEILIAGCGTGQHSIGTATRFKSSKTLAIDLSLSSLAYAKRETDKLGVKNIEYMQADILNLGQLNKQFDIIESSGVLHHMDNPLVGWKVLTGCLKPGGLMKIGLYSELARQRIVEIRNEIKQAGIGSSNAEMKSFRDTIIQSKRDHHKQVLKFSDFYSLSELKDLLFHVQEHRFTIPQIKDFLNELGLKFCGFESKRIVSHFTQTYKNKDDSYDLDEWQSYEKANTTAFAGMYQFWCQKVD